MNDLPRKLPIWPGAPAASTPKQHVLQRRGPDCAIAAAAMVAGVTYEEAASVAFSLREERFGRHASAKDGQVVISSPPIGPVRAHSLIRKQIRLSSMAFPPDLAVAAITTLWPGASTHAFVTRGQLIYDGSLDNPVSPKDHPSKNWYVSWVITSDLR